MRTELIASVALDDSGDERAMFKDVAGEGCVIAVCVWEGIR